jgi:N4-gp56 family major capsid protein
VDEIGAVLRYRTTLFSSSTFEGAIMGNTAYGVNHPLAQKLWSKKLSHDSIGNTFLNKFLGNSPNSLFQIKTETQKDAGDKITVGLRVLLTGAGIQGDATLEGNEEPLTTYNDAIFVDQLRHAVRSAGKMSEQRIPWDVREESRDGLTDWWTERLDISAANQLTGNTAQTDTRYTGNQATVAPSSTRIVVGGGHSTEASLSATTTHAIQLTDLDRAIAMAKEPTVAGTPRIRPVRVDGKKLWVVFLHPYQILRMRADASTAGNFFDVQKAQLQGGKISDNPIITGAEFIYNGAVVHEWNYLPNTVSAPVSQTNYRRGVLCGAQSLLFARGQGGTENKMTWNEELFDYGNQLGVEAGMILGMKKSVYNSIDFATICLSGYAPPPA